VKNVKLLENQLSLTYFFGGIFTLFTSRIVGVMADKYGKHRMIYISSALSLIPIYMMTNLGHVSLTHVLAVSTLFFILISGRFVPVMALVTSSVTKANRGAFMGINSSIQQMSMGFASMLAGYIVTYNVSGEMDHFHIVGYLSMFMTFVFVYFASKVRIISE
jgi:predicted MFS family arabinose efflux permease